MGQKGVHEVGWRSWTWPNSHVTGPTNRFSGVAKKKSFSGKQQAISQSSTVRRQINLAACAVSIEKKTHLTSLPNLLPVYCNENYVFINIQSLDNLQTEERSRHVFQFILKLHLTICLNVCHSNSYVHEKFEVLSVIMSCTLICFRMPRHVALTRIVQNWVKDHISKCLILYIPSKRVAMSCPNVHVVWSLDSVETIIKR